jgi:hypothetical protein
MTTVDKFKELKLGIIGTAGRGEDGDVLNLGYWNLMKLVTQNLIAIFQPTHLISGGAAYSDHLIVDYFLNNEINLELYLPCEFDEKFLIKSDSIFDCGKISNLYHKKFSEKVGIDSLEQIDLVIKNSKCLVEIGSGFKNRNTEIAKNSNVLLAFTFGDGKNLKDGGTLDTVTKYLDLDKKDCYHFNLNVKKLYKLS